MYDTNYVFSCKITSLFLYKLKLLLFNYFAPCLQKPYLRFFLFKEFIYAKLKNLEAEKILLISEEIDESKALSKAEDTKVRLALMKIDLISQANNGLVENMLMLSNGPQKASGLFGLMVY